MRIRLIKKPKPPRRKPGQRAHLNHPQILDAALAIMKERTGALTVVEIARRLGVYPRAIIAHFPGGLGQILTGLVRITLTRSAPPVRHGEAGDEYLERVFETARSVFFDAPPLAKHVGVELTEDPFVSPLFAERLLGAFRSMRLESRELPSALRLAYGTLAGFLVMEFPPLQDDAPRDRIIREDRRRDFHGTSEFPNLTASQTELIEYELARQAASLDAAALEFARYSARHLIAALGHGDARRR